MKSSFLFGIGITGTFVTASLASAAPTSCYPKELQAYKRATTQTAVVLIDESTPRDATTEKDFKTAVDTLTSSPTNIVLLAYAGLAPGQTLRIVDRWVVEAPITDETIIQDVIISTNKKHQRCIRDQHAQTKAELSSALEKLFTTLPIVTERSEIAYALGSVVADFVRPNESTQIYHYSDGMQYSKGANGRSFYGPDMRARKINAKTELAYFAKDPATAPRGKPQGGFVSVLWWGMLLLPTPERKSEKLAYLDSATISDFRSFWTIYLTSLGADKVQIGTPTLINADFAVPVSNFP